MQAHPLTTVRDSALACHAQAATLLGEDNEITDEVIHALRVQTKRLRAYWQLLQPVVGKSYVKSATKELRDASASFGAARDYHVMLKLLGKLVGKAKKPSLRSALADALKVIADAGVPASESTVLESNAGQLQTAGDAVASAWQCDRRRWEGVDVGSDAASPSSRDVRIGLRRIFKNARKLHQRAVVEQDIERWHELRKWVKYLSLTIPLCGDDPATTIAAGEWARLGKSLGKLHDYDELVKRIDSPPKGQTSFRIGSKQTARAIRWIVDKRDRLCVECDMHARRLLAQRPGPFAKTLVPE